MFLSSSVGGLLCVDLVSYTWRASFTTLNSIQSPTDVSVSPQGLELRRKEREMGLLEAVIGEDGREDRVEG